MRAGGPFAIAAIEALARAGVVCTSLEDLGVAMELEWVAAQQEWVQQVKHPLLKAHYDAYRSGQ